MLKNIIRASVAFEPDSIIPIDKIPIDKKSKVVITFIDEPYDESEIVREITSRPNGFEFWDYEKEDIYQDYLTAYSISEVSTL